MHILYNFVMAKLDSNSVLQKVGNRAHHMYIIKEGQVQVSYKIRKSAAIEKYMVQKINAENK